MSATDPERILAEAVDYVAVPLSATRRARFSGRCPLCDRYIRGGRSRVQRVPEAYPVGGLGFDEPQRRWRDLSTGDVVPMHRRSWAHEKCVGRAVRQHTRTAGRKR